MAPPNIPADFDFLDPDVNLEALPVEQLLATGLACAGAELAESPKPDARTA